MGLLPSCAEYHMEKARKPPYGEFIGFIGMTILPFCGSFCSLSIGGMKYLLQTAANRTLSNASKNYWLSTNKKNELLKLEDFSGYKNVYNRKFELGQRQP